MTLFGCELAHAETASARAGADHDLARRARRATVVSIQPGSRMGNRWADRRAAAPSPLFIARARERNDRYVRNDGESG